MLIFFDMLRCYAVACRHAAMLIRVIMRCCLQTADCYAFAMLIFTLFRRLPHAATRQEFHFHRQSPIRDVHTLPCYALFFFFFSPIVHATLLSRRHAARHASACRRRAIFAAILPAPPPPPRRHAAAAADIAAACRHAIETFSSRHDGYDAAIH